MENFNEKYDRLTTGGVTRFRYPIPGKMPSWMSGVEDSLRRSAGEPTSKFMTPKEINDLRKSQGLDPYSESEFETFGLDPEGTERRRPLQGTAKPKPEPKPDPKPEPKAEPAASGENSDQIRARHAELRKQLERDFPTTRKPEAPTPKAEAPTPKAEAPTPKAEAPAPKAEAPAPKPEAKAPAPKPEAKAPAPKPTDLYRSLVKQGKTKEAEAVGKEIWAKKYAGKFTVPSVEKGGSRIDVSTSAQKELFKAAEKGYNVPRVASIKDDVKELKKKNAGGNSISIGTPIGMPMGGPYEAYDIVLDYLLSEGHVETVEEAHYVMMQMDAEYIQSIVEGFPMTGPIKVDPASKLKLYQDPNTGKRYYVGPGGKELNPGQLRGVMSGELMVKNQKPKPTTQVAHYEPKGEEIVESPGEWFRGRLNPNNSAAAQAQMQSPFAKPSTPLPSIPSPFAKPASRDDSGKLTTYGAGGGAEAERRGQTRAQVMQQGAKNLENKKRTQPVNQGPDFGR